MRSLALVLCTAMAGLLLVGCGGGSAPQVTTTTFTIDWPARGIAAPLASESVRVSLDCADSTNFVTLINRPEAGGTSTLTFPDVPVGAVTMTVTAFPEPNVAGVAQATGSETKIAEGGVPLAFDFSLTSTVDHLEITASATTLNSGDTVQLTATPKNADGETVLVAEGNITWVSSNPTAASVDPVTGLVTGHTSGEVIIAATEQDSGKQGAVNLSVNSKIVYWSSSFGNTEIFSMNADGTNQTRLTDNPMHDDHPAWSPDGSNIVFISDRDGNDDLYVMNHDGTGVTRLTNTPQEEENWPNWSLDGSQIVFSAFGDIYVINPDGTGRTKITSTATSEVTPCWSPDGSRIAYISLVDQEHGALCVMNADGTEQTRLTHNSSNYEYSPAWSPDGNTIAFQRNTGEQLEIYLINPDGTGVTQLTDTSAYTPAWSYRPAWRPDGAQLTFVSQRDFGSEIYTMNADGSNITRLTFDVPTRFNDITAGAWR
ncbi:MAG: DUF5050 domain-containing protein [Armatimonadota bacterium]